MGKTIASAPQKYHLRSAEENCDGKRVRVVQRVGEHYHAMLGGNKDCHPNHAGRREQPQGDTYPGKLVQRGPPTPTVEHHDQPVHQYEEHARQGEEQVGPNNSLCGEVDDVDVARPLGHQHPCAGNDDVPEEYHRASYVQEGVPSIREQGQ